MKANKQQEMEEEIVCNRWKDLAGDQMKEWPGLDKKAVLGSPFISVQETSD